MSKLQTLCRALGFVGRLAMSSPYPTVGLMQLKIAVGSRFDSSEYERRLSRGINLPLRILSSKFMMILKAFIPHVENIHDFFYNFAV